MGVEWYYVEESSEGRDSAGPVGEEKIQELIEGGQLNEESYLWAKGFDDWKKLKNIEQLKSFLEQNQVEEEEDVSFQEMPGPMVVEELRPMEKQDLFDFGDDEKKITIKIGADRGGQEVEYGPFSKNIMKKLMEEKRINEKTFIFISGMSHWQYLGETPLYGQLTNQLPPVIEQTDQRAFGRRPFIAKILFHNNEQLFEGVCRDISIGGLQVLVSGFPGGVGDIISMNVHPDNGELNFTAKGKIVRNLDGGQGLALRFIGLDGEAQGLIQKYVDFENE